MRSERVPRWVLVAGLLVGAPVLSYSFRFAAPHTFGQMEFLLFWVGFLAFAIPAVWRAVARTTPDGERWLLLVALGAWDFVPKLLRNPSGPLFADELAHWRSAVDVAHSGALYVDNTLLSIIKAFPGQQGLVAAVHLVTGLSVWHSGEVTLLALHVGAVVAMMLLASRLTSSPRTGAIAAAIYALNPGFMFFDSQFSYESYSLTLFLWTIAAAVFITHPDTTARARRGWLVTGLVTSAACVVTHHLSSYFVALVLAGLVAARAVLRRRGGATEAGARELTILTGFTVAAAVLWLVFPAQSSTVGYYSPYITGAYHETLRLFSNPFKGRHLFHLSVAPRYEKVSAYLAPLIIAAFVVYTVRKLRRRIVEMSTTFLVLSGFVLLYFASLPVILTAFGNEGARRSWSFSYVGVSLFCAWAFMELSARWTDASLRRLRMAYAAAGVALVVLLIGNTSSAISVEYRFPGPYVFGSDTRSFTPELVEASSWFRRQHGPGNGIMTDRYTSLAFGSVGGQVLAQPSIGFPFWDLFLEPRAPSARLLQEISLSPYAYVVVDDRMASNLPRAGAYFAASEPQAIVRTHPPPIDVLERFDRVSWATEIYRSTHFSIYRLDLPAIAAVVNPGS